MKNSVMIKGNKYGIVVVLDEKEDFSKLKEQLKMKFEESSKFFNNSSSMAISFEGKKLSNDEQREILDMIQENTELNIVCVMDSADEERCKNRVEEVLSNMNDYSGGQFYKGTLRSGQVLESDSSIIILGDVNPGAKILSAGNVVILGSLKGTVYAGIKGNPNAFVVALEMHPVQIKIGDIIARCADKPKKSSKPETKIAYVDGENIYIEPLNREVLNDLNF
ncbi:MAG: septum site-determining protein MinC [Lachnospiraceae bacterium]|nr:septum site-determining protein MinC [Lachnospiraceae bacterium]